MNTASKYFDKGDYKKALSQLTTLANKDNHIAMAFLSMIYSHGEFFGEDMDLSEIKRHIPYNERLAYKWLSISAKKGDKMSQYELARAYSKGLIGLERDEKTALSWYRKSAKQGHPKALYNIGNMYRQGRGGLKINYKKAIEYYKNAENSMQKFRHSHHANALYNIGTLYYHGGHGIHKSKSKAYQYFSKANAYGQRSGSIAMIAICRETPYIKECR